MMTKTFLTLLSAGLLMSAPAFAQDAAQMDTAADAGAPAATQSQDTGSQNENPQNEGTQNENTQTQDAQARKDAIDAIGVTQVKGNIYMLQAGGGNVGVSAGDDGIFVIDDSVPDDNSALLGAVRQLSNAPVRLLINTHWHYDHTGNNADFGDSDVLIMAHDNVRQRLKDGGVIEALDKTVEPAEPAALPVITFDSATSVYMNGEKADIMYFPPAHTDGDSVIYWRDLNVMHAGDIFFNGLYPFIDKSSGGDLNGLIAAVEKIMLMVNKDTVIIPGHGPIANKEDLHAYYLMLTDVATRVKTAKASGKSLEQWKSENPLALYEDKWGGQFLSTDQFMDILWSLV